ncbi:MAG: thermonuclease family protein [Candidatus Omnitrophica bacterium]|nr:thermonuclease family protein [Candidatus Omnitrophota bacterium]
MNRKLSIVTLLIFCFSIASLNALAQNNNSFLDASDKKTIAKVDDIINSATIRLVDSRKIKLIGLIPLDKPKRKDLPRNEYGIIIEQDDPIIPLEQTAYDFVLNLLKNKDIRLDFDNLYRDSDGYILAYVFLKNGTFVNAEIIRQGFSDLHMLPQNTKYEKELREAYLEAKKEKRGIQGN